MAELNFYFQTTGFFMVMTKVNLFFKFFHFGFNTMDLELVFTAFANLKDFNLFADWISLFDLPQVSMFMVNFDFDMFFTQRNGEVDTES
jgi:hypothetical protein